MSQVVEYVEITSAGYDNGAASEGFQASRHDAVISPTHQSRPTMKLIRSTQ